MGWRPGGGGVQEGVAGAGDLPVTVRPVATLSAAQLDRPVRVSHLRWSLLSAALRLVRPLDAGSACFQTGRFVAGTTRQSEVPGPVPTAEDPVRRWPTPQPAV